MNTKNSKFKTIIIIVAAAIILAGVIFVVYKAVDRFTREEVPPEDIDPPSANITVFKFFMGRTVTDSEIDEIRETVADAVGANKVLNISKAASFSLPDVYDKEGDIVDMGDGIDIIFSLLDDDEKGNAFGALADKYEITPEHLIGGVRDIYRSDFNFSE